MWVLYFQLVKNHQDVFLVKCDIRTQLHYCGRNAIFSPSKRVKKKEKKNAKLVVFNLK